MTHHQAKNLIDLDMLDANAVIMGQEAQTANSFDFSK